MKIINPLYSDENYKKTIFIAVQVGKEFMPQHNSN
jgi:hypothetical protein